MSLYKVLLVDDEEDVRQSIVKKLDWATLGFEVVGEASNGEEALEMAGQLAPDVIMTDIKMPFMDGLELCRRARVLLPGVRMAIFSGFDEFEYAKEAIAQQVEEYILKPIDADELAAIFRRMRESLDEEIERRRDVERLQRYYRESLPLMRQQVLLEWMNGLVEPEKLADTFAGYGLDIAAAGYCVAALRVAPLDESAAAADARLLEVSVRQLVEDTLQGAARMQMVPTWDGMAIVFLLEEGQDARHVADVLGQLFPIARKLLGVQLSIGVGEAISHPQGVAASYRKACRALEYQILVEPGQCIVIGDIEPGATGEGAAGSFVADIVRNIKIGGEEELAGAVNALLHEVKSGRLTMQQYQEILLELTTELLKLIRTYRLDAGEARLEELLDETRLLKLASLDQLAAFLQDYCGNLRYLVRRERKDSARLLVEKAKDILAQSYSDENLSQDAVCAQLNVSPAYFSTLFKKETGQGFVNYLTGLRMERALELLSTTDDKTYQIAAKVGYADPNYFSYVFKKQFGVSPSKYKADH